MLLQQDIIANPHLDLLSKFWPTSSLLYVWKLTYIAEFWAKNLEVDLCSRSTCTLEFTIILIALFCPAIKRGSVSLYKFPLLNGVQIFLREISPFCHLCIQLYSSYFYFLDFVLVILQFCCYFLMLLFSFSRFLLLSLYSHCCYWLL